MARKKKDLGVVVKTEDVQPVVKDVKKTVAKKVKNERKFIYGSEILSERKIEDRVSIQTFDGITYLLSKDEYAELVS